MEKNVLANLEPKNVLRFFEELCNLPHGPGNTAAASGWVVDFAKARGLRCRRDETDSVVVWKDASPGYEDHPAVMLRCCLELNCCFSPKVDVDTFAKDGLKLMVDGDWIKSYGTSLVGDTGVGVAMAMALLDDNALPHPPLEAVFTVNSARYSLEGTAADLDCSDLKSRYLISIDPREEGVLTGGCAGGTLCDITVNLDMFDMAASGETDHWTDFDGNYCTITLERIGPSGGTIHKGYANPIRLLAECLLELDCPHIGLPEHVRQGEQCDIVPLRVSAALWAQDEKELEILRAKAEAWAEKKKADCPMAENFSLRWEEEEEGWGTGFVLSRAEVRRLVSMLLEAPNGVIARSPDLPDQVRSSVNLWITRRLWLDMRFDLSFCVYSSVPEEKERLVRQLRELAEAHGAAFTRYGWEYRQDSPLWRAAAAVFREQYGKEPQVETIHTSREEAIRECGILTARIPGLEAVSFGPDLKDIHSLEERLSAASLRRTWAYLTALLARL